MKAPLLLVSLFTATDALPGKVGLITEWTQQQKGTAGDFDILQQLIDVAFLRALGRLCKQSIPESRD